MKKLSVITIGDITVKGSTHQAGFTELTASTADGSVDDSVS